MTPASLPHGKPALMLLGAVVLGTAVAGCEKPRAQGDANVVMVAADEDFWRSVEDEFRDQLEPTILSVREERPFRVSSIDPTLDASAWGRVQRLTQIVAIGTSDDRWVADALARVDGDPPPPPSVSRASDVWARGQVVWIVHLTPESGPEEVGRLSATIRDELDERFRAYALRRMYISGRDSIQADSLQRELGFSVQLPNVYRSYPNPPVYRFRNDNPSPAELIRELAVTWVEPIPDEMPTRDELMEWRLQLAAEYYNDPQDFDTTVAAYRPVEVNGLQGVEFQSAWVSLPDEWPAGGPFITRALVCPEQNRLYKMDAWLYAPGRDKYEYMIQLQTILDSFRCGGGG